MRARIESETKVLELIDRDALLAALCELVAIPSLGGKEQRAQEWMADRLQRAGLLVDVWDLDFSALRQHPAFSMEIDRDHGLGVVGTWGDEQGPGLILNGHTDVVPVGAEDLWHYPPWQGTVAGGRVYGRGALDMKGGLICALCAVQAVIAAGISLRGKVIVQSVIGEEDGGVGTLGTLMRGYRADGAIVMEPTQMNIAPACAGALNFRISIQGQSAHGAMREEGVSAIELFYPLYQAIMALERERNQEVDDPLYRPYKLPFAITIGLLQAGDWASNVAAHLVCEGRMGVAAGEDVATARQALEKCISAAAQKDPWLRRHPPVISWWGAQFLPARTPAAHPLVTICRDAVADVSGQDPRLLGMTYGADMGLLAGVGGIPTVLFGPGDIRHAHRPDEFVPTADLMRVTQALAITILRFCGYDK